MVNINAYLTNYNSFSSTTNQFISSDAAPRAEPDKSLSSTFLLSDTFSTEGFSSQPSQSSTDLAISSVHVPSHDAKSALDERAFLTLPAGKFRVSRDAARRIWEKPSAEVQSAETQDVVRNRVLKPSVDSTASASTVPATARIEAGKIEEGEIESAKAIASLDLTPTKLPLARTRIAQSQIQRKSLTENANVSRTPTRIREVKETAQPAEAERPPAPAAVSVQFGLVEPPRETKTADSSPPAPGREDVPRQTSKTVPTTTSTTPLPLAQKQGASPPIQQRPPDFIWRNSADVPTLKEFASAISKANPLQSMNQITGGLSTVQPQPQQSSQTFTPEAERRTDEPPAGSGISTERILRNISRKLLIERERRGY